MGYVITCRVTEERRVAMARLTPQQEARLRMAREDLEQASRADLADSESAALVLLVARLRSALHDALRLVDELSE